MESLDGLELVDLVSLLNIVFCLGGYVKSDTEIRRPLLRHEPPVPVGGVDLRQNFLELRDQPKVITWVTQGSPTKDEADVQLIFAIRIGASFYGAVPSRGLPTTVYCVSDGSTGIQPLS